METFGTGHFLHGGSPIVVTGAAGFIGSYTCEDLLEHGYTVVGVDNLTSGTMANLEGCLASSRFLFRNADIAAPGVLNELATEFSPAAIIHLAALVSVPASILEPERNFELNVRATFLVAEAARQGLISRIVFASSAAVYGDGAKRPLTVPRSPYGAAKLASESLLLGHAAAYGTVVRLQRYFNVYGSRQNADSPYSGVISRFSDRLRRRAKLTIYGDGSQTRDYISVRDVAMANRLAATLVDLRSGAADICTGRSVSLNQLIHVMSDHAGFLPSVEYVAARPGDVLHSQGEPATAMRELGFTAMVPFDAGIRGILSTATGEIEPPTLGTRL